MKDETIHFFGEMDLDLSKTPKQVYKKAFDIAENCGYMVEAIKETQNNFKQQKPYPEFMTCNKLDKMFQGKFRLFEVRETAVQWLEESPLSRQIYTEIEGDTGKLYMDRGFHLVNRTGIYAVVEDDRFTPIKYKELSKPKLGSWTFDGDYWKFQQVPKEIEKCLVKLKKLIDKNQNAAERFNDKLSDGVVPESQQWNNPYESQAYGLIEARDIIINVFKLES